MGFEHLDWTSMALEHSFGKDVDAWFQRKEGCTSFIVLSFISKFVNV